MLLDLETDLELNFRTSIYGMKGFGLIYLLPINPVLTRPLLLASVSSEINSLPQLTLSWKLLGTPAVDIFL